LLVGVFARGGSWALRTDLVDLGGLAELLLGLVVRHLGGLIEGIEESVVD